MILSTKHEIAEGLAMLLAQYHKPAPEIEMEQRLTLEEAAALCRTTKATFRKWIKSGIMPSHGPGKIKHFFRSEVINALNNTRK